jgi:hypothetical protein
MQKAVVAFNGSKEACFIQTISNAFLIGSSLYAHVGHNLQANAEGPLTWPPVFSVVTFFQSSEI